MADDWTTTADQTFEEMQAKKEEEEKSTPLFSGKGVSKDDVRGFSKIEKNGWYHLEIAEAKLDLSPLNSDGRDQFPHCQVRIVNVGRPDENLSPPGSSIYHTIFLGDKGGGSAPEWAVKNAIRFCLGIGVMKPKLIDGVESIVDGETGDESMTGETFLRCEGKQFVAEVRQQKVKTEKDKENFKKYGPRFEIANSQTYDVRDPKVKEKGVPLNLEALELIGTKMDDPPIFVWDEAAQSNLGGNGSDDKPSMDEL